MATNSGRLDPDDAVPNAGQGQIILSPVIEDLLRTRYCIPGTTLLVEKLKITPVSRSGRWRAVMLLLGDGKLCIQALLGGGLHRFVETGQIAVGAYVRLDEFLLRFHEGDEQEEGKPTRVVYLAVEDLVTIGWNKSYQDACQRQTRETEQELRTENDLDLEEASLEYKEEAVEKAQQEEQPEDMEAESDSDDEDDAFEDVSKIVEPRNTSSRFAAASSNAPASSTAAYAQSSAATKGQVVAMPRDWHDRQTPLKLTTLRSIPLLPYAQNWTCNVLGIIASLSEVETSHLPPYRQRIARIADPSTAKRVHLTIFLNPENFTPMVGSVVLLVGVKNHRFDGGSLKKYASDAVPAQWWFENPIDLSWCDVNGLQEWWSQMQRSQNP
ncbi:hypothetical protein CC79DRAFT_834768 [Sarocladium strictum]